MPEKARRGKGGHGKHGNAKNPKPAKVRSSRRQKKRYVLARLEQKGFVDRNALESALNKGVQKKALSVAAIKGGFAILRCERSFAVSGKAKAAILASGKAVPLRASGTIKSLKETLVSKPKHAKLP